MKLFLSIVILLLAFTGKAQLVISGIITSAEDHDSIPKVAVFFKDNPNQLVLSSDTGTFHIPFNGEVGSKLVFRHPGYKSYTKEITKKNLKRIYKDTIYLRIKLEALSLKTFVVSSVYRPDTVFGSTQISISDYELEGDKYVFLAYDQTLKKGSKIVYADKKNKIIASYFIPDRAERLFRDYQGKLSVICKSKVYRIIINKDNINLIPWESELFYEHVKPIIDSIGTKYYYSNFNEAVPAFEYKVYNLEDSSTVELAKLEDEFIMELYRAQYKYLDGADKLMFVRKEQETGIDKEIWAGATYFTGSAYYEPLYAPLFKRNNKIIVFDHYSDMLYKYNAKNECYDSTVIYHHKIQGKTDWQQELIQDEKTEEIYTVFRKGPYQYLSKINTENGELRDLKKLYYKYVENIKIIDGFAYYIYRPFESSQKKFLYKERIDVD